MGADFVDRGNIFDFDVIITNSKGLESLGSPIPKNDKCIDNPQTIYVETKNNVKIYLNENIDSFMDFNKADYYIFCPYVANVPVLYFSDFSGSRNKIYLTYAKKLMDEYKGNLIKI